MHRCIPIIAALALTFGPSCVHRDGSEEPSERVELEPSGSSSERERSGAARAEAEESPPAPEEDDETPAAGDMRAPDEYTVVLETTEGDVVIDVHREWAPRGADRFYTLVKGGYYEDVAFFRVIEGFMAQAGLSGDPETNAEWRERRIPDDPPAESNTRGRVSFATAGPNSRTTQIFINYGDNSNLDAMGFAPFGEVRDMGPVDRLHAGYGESPPRGRGPTQRKIHTEGNAYLREHFPELDYIVSARIVGEE